MMTAQSSFLSGKRRQRQTPGTGYYFPDSASEPEEASQLKETRSASAGRSHDPGSYQVTKRRYFQNPQDKNKPRIQPQGLYEEALNAKFAKRLFDIGFSLLVLILFSPVYLLLAMLVACSSKGPIFYVQQRVGKNYKLFNCIKFRTMVTNADEVLAQIISREPHLQQEFEDNFKLKQDPRITTIGKFLRITSLDEFPQFLNVLKGDMSVVGPRPLVPEELPKYGTHIEQVLTIRPGITGLWQVSGRNDIPYPRRIQIDLHYVKFRNFWLDLWIIIKTIGVVIIPKDNGAY